MKKNLFSTMLALLTIVGMLVSVGCKNYDDDISDINKKIAELESGSIASVESQVASLNSSVSALQSTQAAIEKEIQEVEDAVVANTAALAALASDVDANAAEIENLKLANNELAGQIAVLQNDLKTVQEAIAAIQKSLAENYVDNDQLKATLATYATQDYVTDAIAAAKSAMSDDLKAIVAKHVKDSAAFAQTCEEIKAAVEQAKKDAEAAAGETLKVAIQGVYDSIQVIKDDLQKMIDANTAAIAKNDALDAEQQKEIDANKAAIAELQEKIGEGVGGLKEKVEDALSRIEKIEGKLAGIDGTVADAINAAIKKFQEETYPELQAALVSRIEALESQVRSVVFVPQEYDQKSVVVNVFTLDKEAAAAGGYYALRGFSVMRYQIKPESAAANLKPENFEVLTIPNKLSGNTTTVENAFVYSVDNEGNGIVKLVVTYEYGNVQKFVTMKDFIAKTSTSIAVKDRENSSIQAPYMINKLDSKDGQLSWVLYDGQTKIDPDGKFDNVYDRLYTMPWTTAVADSKVTLLKDYDFYFTFDYIDEYFGDKCTKIGDKLYVTTEQLDKFAGLEFKGVHKDQYDAKKDVYTVKEKSQVNENNGALKLENSAKVKETEDGWYGVAEALPTAEFSKAYTEWATDTVYVVDEYALKCGSLYFPNGNTIKVKASYAVGESIGTDFTVTDMSQAWSFAKIVELNKWNYYWGSDLDDTPGLDFAVKTTVSVPTGDLSKFFGTERMYSFDLQEKKAEVTVEIKTEEGYKTTYTSAQVQVDKNEYGDECFTFNLQNYEWGNEYKVVAKHLSDSDKKYYTVTGYIKTGEMPGEIKEEAAGNGLWEKGDRVIELGSSELETLAYDAKLGNWTSGNAWDQLQKNYSKYFDFADQYAQADTLTSILKYSIEKSYNYIAKTSFKVGDSYVQMGSTAGVVPAAGNSNAIGYQTPYNVQDAAGKTHSSWRGYIDPVSVNAVNNEYIQEASYMTWLGIRFVSTRNIKVTLSNYTLKANELYVKDNTVTLKGESTTAPWAFKDIDMGVSRYFYLAEESELGSENVKYVYENISYNNQKDNDSSAFASPKYHPYVAADTKTCYEPIRYASIEDNVLKLSYDPSTEAAKVPQVISNVWVKVKAQYKVPAGVWIDLTPAYFKYNVVNPIADFSASTVNSAQMIFQPGQIITANDTKAANWPYPATWLSMTASDGQNLIKYKPNYDTKTGAFTGYTETYKYYDGYTTGGYLTGIEGANYNGLLINTAEAVFKVNGVEQPANTIADVFDTSAAEKEYLHFNPSTGEIQMKCKNTATPQADVTIEIPVSADHNVFNTTWVYDKESNPIAPFAKSTTLTITVKAQ